MDTNLLKSVVSQIHKKYPEFAGCQPTVRQQSSPQAKSLNTAPNFLLTFQSSGRAQANQVSKTIPRWMRVVVNQQGKILKITTSR
jgi:hypothetical protein